MDFIDLKPQAARIRADVDRRIAAVLDHGRFVLGPEVAELEQALADYVGVKHCISCANGTDALLLCYLALDIRPGQEVLTSPFSFIAAAEMAALIGAVPRYADIERPSYNMDPQRLAEAIGPQTAVIVPVDLFGQCARYEEILEIADARGIPVIEDAAQSFGAQRHGRCAGSFGRLAITSFYPAKPLGCYGEGGACFTDDDALAQRLRELRVHGQDGPYRHGQVGINGRLETLQAAVLLAKLAVFDEELELRARVAARYAAGLEGLAPAPVLDAGNTSAWAQYTIEVDDREAVRERLSAAGVPSGVYYPIPLHKQGAVGDPAADCPLAESAAERVLSLPFSPYLSAGDQDRVIAALRGG